MKRTSNALIPSRDLSVSARQDGARYELIAEFPAEHVVVGGDGSSRYRRYECAL